MLLLPCVLLGDFSTESISAAASRTTWTSTSGSGSASLSQVDTKPMMGNQCFFWDDVDDAGDDYIAKGDGSNVFTDDDINNPYGSNAADFSWCTHMGMWMYYEGTKVTDRGADPVTMYMSTSNYAGKATECLWSLFPNRTPLITTGAINSVPVNTWFWTTDVPSVGSFTSGIKSFGICNERNTAYFGAPNDVYLNSFMAYTKEMSLNNVDTLGDGAFNWKYGLELPESSVERLGQYTWKVSGRIFSPYVSELRNQLHQMETQGLAVHDILGREVPKYQTMHQSQKIKTYLMWMNQRQEVIQKKTAVTVSSYQPCQVAVPIIISNLQTSISALNGGELTYSFIAYRFGGL